MRDLGKFRVGGVLMRIVEALGAPCCNCGSKQIISEPAHLVGACAKCSPAVLAEQRWNYRVARAAGHVAEAQAAQQTQAPASRGYWARTSPARKEFGRLPRRQGTNPSMRAVRQNPVQLALPGV